MQLAGATGNVEFLCALMYAKETQLLSRSQLELLKSVKYHDELMSVLSGTVFHRFVSEKKGISESILNFENGAATEVRNFFKIEPDLMLLSVLDSVSEAYKIIAFGDAGSVNKERVFLCGLKAEELLNPESLALPAESISKEILMTFRQSMEISEDPFALDVRMYGLKKKARQRLSEKYGEEVKSLVSNMDMVSDVFNVIGWVKFKLPDAELMFEKGIFEHLHEKIRSALEEFRKERNFEAFADRIFSDLDYQVLKDFSDIPEDLEALYAAWETSLERLLTTPAFSPLTPAYPLVFMHRYYRQVREIKKAIFNLENLYQKQAKGVTSRA